MCSDAPLWSWSTEAWANDDDVGDDVDHDEGPNTTIHLPDFLQGVRAAMPARTFHLSLATLAAIEAVASLAGPP